MTQEIKNIEQKTTEAEQSIEQNEAVGMQGMEQDATDTTETLAEEANYSEAEAKAAKILRARLEGLTAAGLNFEKRTGNFFKSTIEKIAVKDNDGNPKLDKKGSPIYLIDEHGQVAERTRRIVVDIENEDGTVKEEFAHLVEEINAKRAAALVLDTKRRERLEAEGHELVARLEAITTELEILDAQKVAAATIVEDFKLPEKAERVAVKEKLKEVEDTNAKLRALLEAAGIDPDTGKPFEA